MSLFFLSNIHFAVELMGAVAMLMAAWLTFDTYIVKKDGTTLTRGIGLSCIALWQVIFAVNLGGDVALYIGFIIYLVGLICVAASFIPAQQLHMQAVLVLPSFTAWAGALEGVATVLLGAIAALTFRKMRLERNGTWTPFLIGFVVLALGSFVSAFGAYLGANTVAIVSSVTSVIGFACIVRWVWQFLALRIRESLVLIFISAALFLSTLITLAFSTILINQVATQTEASLVADVQVLKLSIDGLRQESHAKAALIATADELTELILANNFEGLNEFAEHALEDGQLGFVTIADAEGSVLVRAHALSRRGDSVFGERAFEEASQGRVFATVEESDVEGLSIRAGAPILLDGRVIGVVIAGYPLDNAFVDNIKRITGLDMFVYEGGTTAATSAFERNGRTRLTGIALSDQSVRRTVLEQERSATAALELRGERYRMSFLPLENGDEKTIGIIAAGKLEQDILELVQATNRLTLITILCIMLLLTIPVYLFTRRFAEGSV